MFLVTMQFKKLKMNISTTGVIRDIRAVKCVVQSIKQMEKLPQGYYYHRFTTTGKMEWQEMCSTVSNFHIIKPEASVNQLNKRNIVNPRVIYNFIQ